MPIANLKTSVVTENKDTTIVEPPNHPSIVYSDENKPLHSLIGYVSGSSWTVKAYYRQVLGPDSEIGEIDISRPGTHQQYEKINNLEIRTSGGLSTSYNSDTGISSLSGSGTIYPFMIPNKYDYFVAEYSDNKLGIFKLTNVTRKNASRDSVHEIEYQVIGYTDTLLAVYQDLEDKTIREVFFSKDRLVEGLSPTLRSEEYNNTIELKHEYRNIIADYFSTFYQKQPATLVIPGQEFFIYDKFVVDFIFQILERDDAPELMHIKQMPTNGDRHLEAKQFWDCLSYIDYKSIRRCNQKMGFASVLTFNANIYVNSLRYVNVDYIIYPLTPDVSFSSGLTSDVKPLSTINLIETKNILNTTYDYDALHMFNGTQYKLVPPVTQDDYYVLSGNFYNNTAGQTILELLVKNYLNDAAIDLDMLRKLCEEYPLFERLEQFYYGPILLLLIKKTVMNFHM